MAVLALSGERLVDHPRVKAGIHLILKRALRCGGWNYGNSVVFGRELRAQPGPSGIALLALAASGEETAECRRGIDYLRESLKEVRSGVSLGWGVLGLRVWDACPRKAGNWLAESYRKYGARADQADSLSLLLLAASERGPDLLVKSTKRALIESHQPTTATGTTSNPS
jgi:hypothetical protein